MKTSRILLALATVLLLTACEAPADPVTPSVLSHHTVDHLNASVDRIWVEHQQWEFVRPRPPGIGARVEAVRIYQTAPVDADHPLSPPITWPVARGAVDHVVDARGRRGWTAAARTVPVVHPGWDFMNCVVHPVPGEGRIAYRMLDPAPPPPCFQVATVYAVDLDDDGCFQPLTSVDRIERAAELGLVLLPEIPEEPWPFAIRPLTEPGQGQTTVESPACVDP